jgi:2-hydroxy-3-oxopropionate reductase
LHTARQIGFDAPITAELERLYAQAFEHGFADLDQSGLFCELARLQTRQG